MVLPYQLASPFQKVRSEKGALLDFFEEAPFPSKHFEKRLLASLARLVYRPRSSPHTPFLPLIVFQFQAHHKSQLRLSAKLLAAESGSLVFLQYLKGRTIEDFSTVLYNNIFIDNCQIQFLKQRFNFLDAIILTPTGLGRWRN